MALLLSADYGRDARLGRWLGARGNVLHTPPLPPRRPLRCGWEAVAVSVRSLFLLVMVFGCASSAPVQPTLPTQGSGRYLPPPGQTYEPSFEQQYREQRMREQILQHGAGGCTPDFATGGCL